VFNFTKGFVLSGLRISAVVCLFVITLIAAFNLSGCGGSSAPISVAVVASATTADGSGGASGSGAAQTVTLTATVTNDKSTGSTPDGVTWTVSGAPSSSLSNTSTTGATFTAPAATNSVQTVTITATSVADTSKTGTATITVPALIVSTTTTAQLTATVGTVYSQQLTVSGGNGTNTWTTTPVSGSLPAGWTLTSGGLLSGPTAPTAGQAGTYTFTLAVKDSGTYSATPQLTVTINPAPTITFPTTTTLTAGTYNVVYAGASVAATGGAGGLTYAVTSGSLPNGLGLNTSSGAITGTTTVVGTFNFKVTATDNFGDTMISPQYTIVVSYPAMNIVTASPLPTGYIGSSYPSITLAATGGTGVATNYTWVVTGSNALPAGLSLSTAGVLSGQPTGSPSGPTSITFQVTDTVANVSTTKALSITVGAGISITPAAGALPEAYANSAYSSGNLTASGGSGTGYTWAPVSGSAPPSWLTLSATSGSTTTLTGTPTAVASAASFSLKVTDSVGNTATIAYNVTVGAGISISPVTGTTLAEAYANSPYTSVPLTASGGNGTYTWSVVSGSAPPSWMSLSATSGSSINLTGTPTAAASAATFGLKITDTAGNSATVSYSITVGTGIGVSPVTGTSLTAYTGATYTSPTLTATGGSGTGYTWSTVSGSLPPSWLSLSSTSGSTTTLTGNPTTVATAASFSLKVTDSGGNSQTVTYSITVNAGISITPVSGALPEAYANSAYSSGNLTASGGSGTGYTWAPVSGSAPPSWLSLSSTSGSTTTLTGTPTTVASAASFSLKVTDSVGNTATIAYNVTVGAGVQITPPTIPTFYPGAAYPATTFTASGGTGTGYTWSWAAASGSTLPNGLSLGSITGAITGTPANATSSSVTSNVVVTAKDSGGNTITTNVSITIAATLAVTSPATLKSGLVGSAYSQQLTASGGIVTSGYTWSVTSGASSMATLGLSLSSSGLLTAPAFGATGSATFTAQVSDNAGTPHTASATLTVNVTTLSITTTSLPAAYTGTAYSQPLATTGGSVSDTYLWSVSINNTGFTGLGLSINSSNGTISGTAAGLVAGSATFTVSVTDTTISATATQQFTINVYAPLSMTAPSSTVPGPAITNTAYTGNTIYASGGSGNYSWSFNGSLPPGMSYSNPTGSSLVVSGTALAMSTSENMDIYLTLTDTTTLKTYGPITYSILVGPAIPLSLPAANPTSLPSAIVSTTYSGAINAAGGSLSGYVWSINGSAVPINGTAFPLSDNLSAYNTGGSTLSINGLLGSTAQTITLTNVTVTDGAGDNAGPVTYTISVNPVVPTGYSVSGTLTYTGTNTGWVYLALTPTSGCSSGCNQILGTAIDARIANALKSGVTYTIHGVPIGTYTLSAFMDNLGYGAENASNPTGSLSSFAVTSSGVSGQAVTLTDPSAVNLSSVSAPTKNTVSAFSGGAIFTLGNPTAASMTFAGATTEVETATSYTVEWGTTSCSAGSTGSKSFPAVGPNYNPWSVTGLTNSSAYYFCVKGVNGTSSTSYSSAVGPVTINAPSSGSLLSGTVTFTLPTGVSAAGKTLYAGCYDTNTGNIYPDPITSPVSPQAYSVYVPNGTNCQVFGFLDLNNTGLIGGAGEISNINNEMGMVTVTINGATPANITLPSGNSVADVRTQTNSGSTVYGIGFEVVGEYKLPVAVELYSETPAVSGTVVDVVLPADIVTKAFNGNSDEFDYWPAVTGTPVVNDSYKFNVTYSDGTSEQLTAAVTGVLNAFATSLSPTGTGISTTPNFSWTDPSPASSYVYQFQLDDNNNNIVWEIPPHHSSSNGFSSSITSITWDDDPTNSGDLPSSSYLSNGGLLASTNYSWSISAFDTTYGNEAQVGASFTTTAASLTLNINNKSFGPALAGSPFTGSISASGGSGTYATWTVNSTTITATSLGTAMTFSGNDGLEAYVSGSTLYIVGTPAAAEASLPLNVSVIDSLSNSVTQNFTLVVSSGPGTTGVNDALLSGTYVCKVNGYYDGNGARWATLFSFVANGTAGTITGPNGVGTGIFDTNSRGDTTAASGTMSGTYSIGSDYTGLMTINAVLTSGGTGSQTTQWAVALNDANGATTTATEFRLVEIDDVGLTPSSQHGSGVCYQATTGAFAASTVNGNSFVFGMQGENSSGIPEIAVGRFSVSSGNISASVFETENGGSDSVGKYAYTTGTYTTTTPNATTGRFTLVLPVSSVSSENFAAYIIDANRMFMLETDAGPTKGMQSGDMRKQQQSSYSAAYLNGPFVLYNQGYEYNNTSAAGYDAKVYQGTGNGAGSLTVNLTYEDWNGTYSVGTDTGSIALTFDSSNPGRVTFVGGNSTGSLYLFDTNHAFEMEVESPNGTVNPYSVNSGWLEPQTQPSSPPFANANIAGSYLMGELPRQNSGDNNNIGEFLLNSSGGATGSATTARAGSLQWDQPLSAMGTMSYSWLSAAYGAFSITANGTATMSCVDVTPVMSGETGKAVCIENTSGSGHVLIYEQ
jgi:hypothetical protein